VNKFLSFLRLGGLALLVCRPLLAATGNVIFIHPDGSSLNHWNAARVRWVGPDGELEWDKLPGLAIYRSHMRDSLTATSHGGGTIHAYGVKVPADSYGMDGKKPLVALSGKPQSIMQEAQAAGLAVGIINSGNLDEPGTGVFLASVPSRKMGAEIVAQIVGSGAAVIMGGGERWLLPNGETGRHGPGARTDGRNLIAEAKQAGYTVVYNRDELAQLPSGTKKVLGVFATHHTFNDQTEEALAAAKLPLYQPNAPSVAEMTDAALQVLATTGRHFFLMVEEEGTDNFANVNNAAGSLEALRRGDAAIGVARAFVKQHPDTLLVVAADSDASGLQLAGTDVRQGAKLPPTSDGRDGAGSLPFESAPDATGRRLPFAIKWTGPDDTYGAVLVRAAGKNADRVRGSFDNTDIYRLIYFTLFARELPSPVRQ
jgi:alkaline phosphatase